VLLAVCLLGICNGQLAASELQERQAQEPIQDLLETIAATETKLVHLQEKLARALGVHDQERLLGAAWSGGPQPGPGSGQPPPKGGSAQCCQAYPNIDFIGCDLPQSEEVPNPFIERNSTAQCCQACQNTTGCNGFSSSVDKNSTTICCWLKNVNLTKCPGVNRSGDTQPTTWTGFLMVPCGGTGPVIHPVGPPKKSGGGGSKPSGGGSKPSGGGGSKPSGGWGGGWAGFVSSSSEFDGFGSDGGTGSDWS